MPSAVRAAFMAVSLPSTPTTMIPVIFCSSGSTTDLRSRTSVCFRLQRGNGSLQYRREPPDAFGGWIPAARH